MNDKQFATTLMIVIGVLVGSTVAILTLANVLISDADYTHDTVVQGNIEERIKPIGSVNTGGVIKVAANTAQNPASDAAEGAAAEQVTAASLSAEQIYTQACSACHASGVLNAPMFGDKAGWEPRIEKGTEQLYTSAINGVGAMPPKGGRVDIADADIKKTVDYMLQSIQ